MASLSADLGVSDQTIYNWRRQDAVDRGTEPDLTSSEKEERRADRRRIVEFGDRAGGDQTSQRAVEAQVVSAGDGTKRSKP